MNIIFALFFVILFEFQKLIIKLLHFAYKNIDALLRTKALTIKKSTRTGAMNSKSINQQ